MNEEVAHASIGVDVDDKAAIAGLRRIEAEYERTMDSIDKKHAEASLGADLTQLKKDLKEAEARLKNFQKRSADADLTAGQRKYAREQVKLLEQQVAQQRKLTAAEEKSVDAKKRENAELATQQKRIDAITKREQSRQRVLEQAERRRLAAERTQQREIQRTESIRERAATREAQQAMRAQQALDKEIASIPKLQRRYVELGNSVDRLAASRRKAGGERAKILVDLKIAEAVADMEMLKKTLNRLGEEPPVTIDVKPGRDFGLAVRSAIKDRRFRDVAGIAGREAGDAFNRNFRTSLLGRGLGGIGAIGSAIARGLSNISDATVRLGPFTTSIRGLFTALAVLGPVLVDVVGALGSLVSVAGSAALGVGALGAGLLGGAIPAAAGMAFVIKDVVQEFTAAKKATKAYNDAVMKNGKDSDQAAKKLKELKTVMGNVSDETAKNFVEGQKLGKQWDKLTAPAHADVWNMIGESLKTAGTLLPAFADNTNKTMGIAEKATRRWQEALRSPEGQRVLTTMMTNFSRLLGPVLNGLGSIAGYIGKIGAEASKYLPGLGNTFESWAKGLNDSADGSAKFQAKIRNIVQSAKDVGNLFLAAGRFVKAFFGGGVEAGQKFTVTMTNALNRWTAFLNTTRGQSELKSFFSQAVDGAKVLWQTLAPIAATFAKWAVLLAPAVRILLEGAAAATQFVTALIRVTSLQGPLSALVTTLGVLWGIGKISAATRAVAGFTGALLGMGRAQKAVAATSAVSAGASALGGAGAAAGVARAVGPVSRLAKAGGIATRVMTGLGAATLGIASPLAGGAILAGALGFGIYKLATRTREYTNDQKAAEAATRATNAAIQNLEPSAIALTQEYLNNHAAQKQVRDAEKAVNQLRKDGKTKTDEYTQAVMDLRQAELNQVQSKNQLHAASKAQIDQIKTLTSESSKALKERQQQTEGLGDRDGTKKFFEEATAAAKKAGKSLDDYLKNADFLAGNQKKRILEYRDALGAQERAQYRVNRALELTVLGTLNQKRAMQGLAPLAQQTAGYFARLQKLGGKTLTNTIATKYTDAGSATRVAQSAAKTLRSGVPKELVLKIVADSKNAEDAVRRLQAVRLSPAKLAIIESGGKGAVAMLERIKGTRLSPKQQAIAERGGPAVYALLRRILGLKLSRKDQAVFDRGGIGVLGILNRINSTRLQNKTQTITIETKRINTAINRVGSSVSQALGKAKATGRRGGGSAYTALIGEGASDEYHYDAKTGRMSKTNGPEFRRLGANDAVIPTEPRYRAQGRNIFKQIADDLGIAMHAAGKAPKNPPLSTRGAQIARGQARKKLPKATTYSTSNLVELKQVETAKLNEGNWARQVSLWEGQLQEPDSFLKQVGADPDTGQPLWAIDQDKINGWVQQLENMAKNYEVLLRKIADTEQAVNRAMARIGDPSAKSGGIIGRTYENARTLMALMKREDGILVSKSGNKADKQAAAQRKNIYKEALGNEQATRAAATTDFNELSSEKNDIFFRKQEAAYSVSEYRNQEAAVQGKAEDAAAEATPPVDPFAGANRGLAALDAEQALAAIGQSLTGGPARGSDAINADIVSKNQSIIDTAKGMLADSDPSNDSSALSAIQNAAQAIAGITNAGASSVGSGSGGPGIDAQRWSIQKSFGSNFETAGWMGTNDSMNKGASGGFGFGANPAAAGQSGGNGGIVFNQTFMQPPDPHTFSQGVAFELKSAGV